MGVMPYNIRQCRGKGREGYLPSPFMIIKNYEVREGSSIF